MDLSPEAAELIEAIMLADERGRAIVSGRGEGKNYIADEDGWRLYFSGYDIDVEHLAYRIKPFLLQEPVREMLEAVDDENTNSFYIVAELFFGMWAMGLRTGWHLRDQRAKRGDSEVDVDDLIERFNDYARRNRGEE